MLGGWSVRRLTLPSLRSWRWFRYIYKYMYVSRPPALNNMTYIAMVSMGILAIPYLSLGPAGQIDSRVWRPALFGSGVKRLYRCFDVTMLFRALPTEHITLAVSHFFSVCTSLHASQLVTTYFRVCLALACYAYAHTYTRTHRSERWYYVVWGDLPEAYNIYISRNSYMYRHSEKVDGRPAV